MDESEVFLMDMQQTDLPQDLHKQVAYLTDSLAACSPLLTAMGDETRQHLIMEMLKIGKFGGLRVGEITERTNLSRPAVSHHLQILKNAGIVKMRREGTKNYYYFNPQMQAFDQLINTMQLAKAILQQLPDRSGE